MKSSLSTVLVSLAGGQTDASVLGKIRKGPKYIRCKVSLSENDYEVGYYSPPGGDGIRQEGFLCGSGSRSRANEKHRHPPRVSVEVMHLYSPTETCEVVEDMKKVSG